MKEAEPTARHVAPRHTAPPSEKQARSTGPSTPRPQPETEKVVRELMVKQGITIAMAN